MSYNLSNSAQGGSGIYVKAGLTGISGGASTYTTSATTLQCELNGKMFTKTQVSGGASPTTDINTGVAFPAMAINKVCVFVWGLKSDGTVVVAQGPVQAWTDTSANSTVCPFPYIPDTMVPFSYFVLKNGATGAAWTFGSSNWNATGITVDTVVDVGGTLPASPPLTA